MTRRRSDRHGGFTLVEALVAFAIVAAASIVLQRGLVQSRLGLAAAAEREAAEWVARDLLAAPLTLADMQNGGRTGMAGGRRFAISLSPLDLPTVDLPTVDTAAPETGQQAASPPSSPASSQPSSPSSSPSSAQPASQPAPAQRWIPMRERITVETANAGRIAIETVKLGPAGQDAR